MRVVCAWCQLELDPGGELGAIVEVVSHGICPACRLEVERNLVSARSVHFENSRIGSTICDANCIEPKVLIKSIRD